MTDPRIRATRPEIWFNNVTSICPDCGRDVNGKHHLTASGHVVMRQFCPTHGHRAALVSTDFEWFTRYEQMAAVFPPRPDRPVPDGTCCLPELPLESDPAERARRLLWLKDASPGAVHFTGPTAPLATLTQALTQARQVGTPCISVSLPAARLLDPAVSAALESAGALAHVDAEDPDLPELLERHPHLPLVQISPLDRPAADLSAPLAAAFRRFREAPSIVSWELIPRGTISSAWHRHDHHPSKGPDGQPSNGPVPPPGPVPATLSEALPLVTAATGLDKEAFFPLQRFHPPGSALAVLRASGGTLHSLNRDLSPRAAIDLIAGQVPLITHDPALLAVRALFGATGRLHPTLVTTLTRQALREGGSLVADDHRADASGPPPTPGAIKTLIVHHPLTRDAYDRTRHLRACPLPRDQRDACNDACTHRAR